MDTVDMTFDAVAARLRIPDLPMTEIATALTQSSATLRGAA